jgi:hypothetical protein
VQRCGKSAPAASRGAGSVNPGREQGQGFGFGQGPGTTVGQLPRPSTTAPLEAVGNGGPRQMITLHRQKSWPLVKVRQERTEPGLRLAFHSSINMIDAIVDLKNPFTNLVVTETTTDGKQDGKQLVPAGKTHRSTYELDRS